MYEAAFLVLLHCVRLEGHFNELEYLVSPCVASLWFCSGIHDAEVYVASCFGSPQAASFEARTKYALGTFLWSPVPKGLHVGTGDF